MQLGPVHPLACLSVAAGAGGVADPAPPGAVATRLAGHERLPAAAVRAGGRQPQALRCGRCGRVGADLQRGLGLPAPSRQQDHPRFGEMLCEIDQMFFLYVTKAYDSTKKLSNHTPSEPS